MTTAPPAGALDAPAETSTPARTARVGKPDAALAAAVDLARAAAEVEATEPGRSGRDRVGEHLGAAAEGERVVLHRFAATDPAYVGWVWAVELTRASRSKAVTVDDVVLLPADGALLAPAWVPYEERVRPGDLRVGDVLPTAADDQRLVLTRGDVEGWSDDALWLELGLGRPRVLSVEGRAEAADRWWDGEPGPEAPIARAAPATCASCGFWVRLVGALGSVFGVCANALAPDDGSVVATAHGCGAHSEAVVVTESRWADLPAEDTLELIPPDEARADEPSPVEDLPAEELPAEELPAEEPVTATDEAAVTDAPEAASPSAEDAGDAGDAVPDEPAPAEQGPDDHA